MENPQYTHVDLSSGTGILPSGVSRYNKTILAISGEYDSDLSSFIFEDYNYKVQYRYNYDTTIQGTIESSGIYRKRPYLNTNMGLDLSLASGEYYIDFDTANPTIYASGVSYCVFIWDEITVPSGRICDTIFSDLNPLNEANISYDQYFLVLGD